ncbi:hypothetical protein HELRODRAFT_81412, partial [Helobdella robusta]|uniref:K Homology domain-containing protein n=1 Tax=Helobdella robusta TaxID=6412 RepID=T1G4E1_HELRO
QSANTTDKVHVPSSEHVAEIVGRQGCKIKNLRFRTNTYIRTPPRDEEPVFVITGREADVREVRREIEEAAHHFTQLRANRKCRGGVQSKQIGGCLNNDGNYGRSNNPGAEIRERK